MTVVDICMAVLASLALTALLTRIASHWMSLPCVHRTVERDEHEDGA